LAETLKSNTAMLLTFIALAVGIAFFSPMASPNPDGLDWTVEKYKKAEAGEEARPGFLFADYKVPFIKSESVSTIVSGVAGVIIVMLLFRVWGIYILRRRKKTAGVPDHKRLKDAL